MNDNFSFTHYDFDPTPKSQITGREMTQFTDKQLFHISNAYKTILEFFSCKYWIEEVIDENPSCFILFSENDYEVIPGDQYDELTRTGIATWIPSLGDDCLEKVIVRWLEKTLTAFKEYYGF